MGIGWTTTAARPPVAELVAAGGSPITDWSESAPVELSVVVSASSVNHETSAAICQGRTNRMKSPIMLSRGCGPAADSPYSCGPEDKINEHTHSYPGNPEHTLKW